MQPRLVLASGSPRRSHLLSEAGFAFVVDAPDVDETVVPGESPEAMVERLARLKATVVAARHGTEACVLACDTTVILDGRILGKPANPLEAVDMLLSISGRSHDVVSGYAIMNGDAPPIIGTVRSSVAMVSIDRDTAHAYVATGEPLDKAGSYAIQGLGRQYVHDYEGSLSNIMGLPMETVVPELAQVGVLPTEPQQERPEPDTV